MNYYVKSIERDESFATIIDEPTMIEAEQGKNCYNPNDFDWLCEAKNIDEANTTRLVQVAENEAEKIAESLHP